MAKKTIENEMNRMRKEMDFLFENFFRAEPFALNEKLLAPPKGMLAAESFGKPLTDFWETKNGYKAEIDLPGIDKKDVKLKITNNVLEIKAEKKQEKKEARKGSSRFERSYNGYYRAFTLPNDANASLMDAKLENGVLKLGMPKKALPAPEIKLIGVK